MSRGHDRPRLHWCATGPFSSLPLHAAGIYDGLKSEKACCDDYIVSSYTPTLTALLYAQRTSTPLARNHASLTLVAEKQAQEPNLPMIPGVIRELGAIVSTVQGKSVQVVNQLAGSTTITDTLGVMKVTNIVHLACHGVQDASDATRSGFCLGNGRLTICNMMDSHLKHGFLAYLSACETGKSAKDQFDHAMILATSVFSTGFSNVVATMW
jgi:CHAT domain-containing protein